MTKTLIWSGLANMHKNTYFDIFDPIYGTKASNGTVFVVLDIICGQCA